jgi:hypothetical protein
MRLGLKFEAGPESGQSTIEFLMTFIFAFAFFILFVKTAINITNGFMVHYATFLASRTYLVWDNNSNTPDGSDTAAEREAIATFQSIPLEGIFNGFSAEPRVFSPTGAQSKLFTGVAVEFQSTMNLGQVIGGRQPLTMLSESFLLREPPRSECLARICEMMMRLGASCENNVTLADNGC